MHLLVRVHEWTVLRLLFRMLLLRLTRRADARERCCARHPLIRPVGYGPPGPCGALCG